MGDYLLENLSAGGALLVDGPRLPAAAHVLLVLQGACPVPLRVGGIALRETMTVEREPATAIAFRHVSQEEQDLLEDLVLGALECERSPGVLVFDRRASFLASMARDLVAVGRRVMLAMTEVEMVRHLGDDDARLGAMVVDLERDPLRASEALDIVRKRFPNARRVAACASAHRQEFAPALARAHAQAVIDVPWTREELSAALQHGAHGLAWAPPSSA